MVTVGALVSLFGGVDVALQYDFGMGRNPEVIGLTALGQTLGELGFAATQQSRKGVLGQGIGHWSHSAQCGRRIRTQGDRHRIGFSRVFQGPVPEIQGTAPVGQPAHNQFARPQLLHAVDAQIHAGLFRPPGNHQWPGHQWPYVPGPAGLHRDGGQVHRVALQHNLLAGGPLDGFGAHVQHLLEQGCLVDQVPHALGGIRLSQVGQQFADLT